MGVGHWKPAALKMLHPRCNHGQGGQGAAGLQSVYPRICISLGRKGQQSCNTAPFHSVPPPLTQNGLQETGFPRETPAGKEAGLGVTPMPQRARLGGSCSPWGRSGGDPGASEVSWLETGARWSQRWEPLAAPRAEAAAPPGTAGPSPLPPGSIKLQCPQPTEPLPPMNLSFVGCLGALAAGSSCHHAGLAPRGRSEHPPCHAQRAPCAPEPACRASRDLGLERRCLPRKMPGMFDLRRLPGPALGKMGSSEQSLSPQGKRGANGVKSRAGRAEPEHL